MLKNKLTKEQYDALPDVLKAEYKVEGENYVIQVEGLSELNRALERERAGRTSLKDELTEANAQLSALADGDTKKLKDIGKLEKTYNDKIANLEATHNDAMKKKDSFIRDALVGGVAKELATSISKAPALLATHIEKRLDVDFSGDKPVTVILDKDGKPSALKIDDLKKEIIANPDYSAIIIASKASGGAEKAIGQQNNSAIQNPANTATKTLAQMTPQEIVEYHAEKKANAAT